MKKSNGQKVLRKWFADGAPEGELAKRTDEYNVRRWEVAMLKRAASKRS